MFHIHTQSGLHGAVIESIATRFTEEGTVSEALVLVRRDDAPFESAPYSQGRLDLAARAGRI